MTNNSHFEINAAVVKQLGEELVSDEITALIELVKNAYDADANYANIIVDTKNHYPGLTHYCKDNNNTSSPGYILIEDDGFGMSSKDITNGWLTISFSKKRKMKLENELTPLKKRTPLGDKGLGRLSTQRLGNRLEIITRKNPILLEKGEEDVSRHVAFDWSEFSEEKTLSSISVYNNPTDYQLEQPGTKLIITNLKSPDSWTKNDDQQILVSQLSQLLFPFTKVRPFSVYLTINGRRIDLETISTSLQDMAYSKFEFSYNDEGDKKLRISGKIKLARLQGQGEKEASFNQFLISDNGLSFFNYLTNEQTKFNLQGMKYIGDNGWFISFEYVFDPESIGGWSLDQNKKIANPGKFYGEIDEFIFRGVNIDPLKDIFSKVADYRDFVSKHVGVRIYKDGFGIRPYGFEGNDWLKLSAEQTSGKSFYGLRPNNVIGYVYLSAKENIVLKEKTDREGFVESPYSKNFILIMDFIVKTLNNLNTTLRRSYNEFIKQIADEQVDNFFSNNIVNDMKEISSIANTIETQVEKVNADFEKTSSSVNEIVTKVNETPLFATQEEEKLSPLLAEVAIKFNEANELINQVSKLLSKLKNIEIRALAIETDIEILHEQISQFSELAGLGLTAEALSHEISIITDNLASRTKYLTNKINNKSYSIPEIITYTEYIQSAISSLRKQLSHLAPSMRYIREQKEKIQVKQFANKLSDFYKTRFNRNGIALELIKPFDNFGITINNGKLTQIFDNLIINSEYWLIEAAKRNEISKPTIYIYSKYPIMQIFDNGYGIDPTIENSLFQPFVTTKPKNIGRGLGLFIVRELLDSSGCSIYLLPEINKYGRRYKFQIDLSGVINDKKRIQ